jgi:hypothetical protein
LTTAYDLPTATRLVATGVCRIDESEPERDAPETAVRAYRHRAPPRIGRTSRDAWIAGPAERQLTH